MESHAPPTAAMIQRRDRFTTPAECEIEISSTSQDECSSEQRGIDGCARRGGAGGGGSDPRAVQFVHFKCTQRRGAEVAETPLREL